MNKFYNSKIFKFSELTIFYIVIPLLVERKVFGDTMLNKILPLLITFVLFTVFLYFDKSFDNHNFFEIRKYNWRKAAIRFGIVSVLVFAFVYCFHRDLLFNFAEQKPEKFIIFLLVYPLVSVIPQEIIYRVYFFYRYKGIFGDTNALAMFNAVLFGYLHFIYDNYLAVVGATLIGIVFVFNYLKTKSLISVSIEHYAYGIMIFTIGLGKFFK